MKPSKHKKVEPWKSKKHILWLSISLIASCFMMVQLASSNVANPRMPKSETHVSGTNKQTSPSTKSAIPTSSSEKKQHVRKAKHQAANKSYAEKLTTRLESIGWLLFMVSIATLIGSLIEARRWHLIFGYVLGKFTRFMRLPHMVSLAMPIALYSGPAANSMLVTGHENGKISHSALIAGGMANSFLSYLSHSLRVVYPVVGAIGIAGVCYFIGQFGLGFLFIVSVLLWNRRRLIKKENNEPYQEEEEPASAISVLSWGKAFKLGGSRVARLLFKMMCLTVPIMLFIELLTQRGLFQFWENHAPEWVQKVFPSELIGIVLAQLGGLVQSASVASELYNQGAVTYSQILLAMFVGSMMGNPIRTMRRNLPSALGIFQAKDAITIVVGMQTSRFISTVILIVITSLYIHYSH